MMLMKTYRLPLFLMCLVLLCPRKHDCDPNEVDLTDWK